MKRAIKSASIINTIGGTMAKVTVKELTNLAKTINDEIQLDPPINVKNAKLGILTSEVKEACGELIPEDQEHFDAAQIEIMTKLEVEIPWAEEADEEEEDEVVQEEEGKSTLESLKESDAKKKAASILSLTLAKAEKAAEKAAAKAAKAEKAAAKKAKAEKAKIKAEKAAAAAKAKAKAKAEAKPRYTRANSIAEALTDHKGEFVSKDVLCENADDIYTDTTGKDSNVKESKFAFGYVIAALTQLNLIETQDENFQLK